MKKCVLIIILLMSSISLYSQNNNQNEIDKLINRSTVEANQNMAKLILEGQIEFLDRKYPIDFISLSLLSNSELCLLRNSIFAKYGYTFKSGDLHKYFSKFTWYKPHLTNVASMLSDVDKRNIEIIQAFEKMSTHSNQIITKDQLIGVWHIFLMMPSGFDSVFQFYPDGTFTFNYSQMRQLPLIYEFSGTFKINGNILDLQSESKTIVVHNSEVGWSGAFGYMWKNDSETIEKHQQNYSFPISKLFTVQDVLERFPESMSDREVIQIADINFYKYSDNPDAY